jgi:hypothetical protein
VVYTTHTHTVRHDEHLAEREVFHPLHDVLEDLSGHLRGLRLQIEERDLDGALSDGKGGA